MIDLCYFITNLYFKNVINSKDVKKLGFQLDLCLTCFIFQEKKVHEKKKKVYSNQNGYCDG